MNFGLPLTKRSFWIPAALVLALAVVAFVVRVSSQHDPIPVRIESPQRLDLSNAVTTNGKVVPIDDFQARANFPGMVDKVYVDVGTKVVAGQRLVKLKDPFATSRVATAKSALAAAQSTDENMTKNGSREEHINLAGNLEHAHLTETVAERTLATTTRLLQQGAASAGEVQKAKDDLDDARAALKTSQEREAGRFTAKDLDAVAARVTDAQEALKAANVSYGNANVTAPENGTVYSILVSNYDFVPMGAELLHIANLNRLKIRAYFDEPEIGQLANGQPVTIVWDAKPEQLWHGHVQRAPLAVTVIGSRNVGECIITVDDAVGDLLPNTNVTVTITLRKHLNVLTIPREALHMQGKDRYIFKVQDGMLKKTTVTVGIINLDRVEIVNGITEGDQIAINAVDRRDLTDGLPVSRLQ